MTEWLLDSVILIDHFNGIEKATDCLARSEGRAAISVITRAEVLAGFEAAHLRLPLRLLDCFPTLVLDKAVADEAAALGRRFGWKLPDAFQAALAQHHGLKLLTRNTRDFPPARHEFVEVPYRL